MIQYCGTGVTYCSWVIDNRKKRIFKHNFCKSAYKRVIIMTKIIVKIFINIANIVFFKILGKLSLSFV